MAKIQQPDGSLVIRKSFWSAISIWWGIIVFLIAIPAFLILCFVILDYIPYMDALKQYAENNGITGVDEAIFKGYRAAVEAEELKIYEDAVLNPAGLLGITSMLVSKMNCSYSTLELIKGVALVLGSLIFISSLVVLIVKKICA